MELREGGVGVERYFGKVARFPLTLLEEVVYYAP